MTVDQFVGYTLLNATAVTTITSSLITYGLRPIGTTLPAINYYDLAGFSRFTGVQSVIVSINCRAETARAARDLADIVITLFAGSDATGTTGTNNGFSVARASLANVGGLIPEPDDNCFNVPVDVRLVSTL